MNAYTYDLPRQITNATACFRQQRYPQFEALSSVETDELDLKYDFPKQRDIAYYEQVSTQQTQQNRPLAFKSLFSELDKVSSHRSHFEKQEEKLLMPQREGSAKKIVQSVYEKLLAEENSKKQKNDQIVTEATFHPRDLKRELLACRQSHSEEKKPMMHPSGRLEKNKKLANSNMHQKTFAAKTKYEKILMEHFPIHNKSEAKEMSGDCIRLSKVYGKNSAILKLKQDLQPLNSERKKMQSMRTAEQKTTSQKSRQANLSVNKKNIETSLPKRESQKILTYESLKKSKKTNELKPCQSERWMSMGFYQRQRRVIENRQQKQKEGKKQKLEKEIKGCTFKPVLHTKSKSYRQLQNNKQTYMELYYQKLYRRY